MKFLITAGIAATALAMAAPASATVIYTVYDMPNMATVDVAFTLPDFASSDPMTPTNVSGLYSSTFDVPLVFAYTSFGGSRGQIGPSGDNNPPFGIVNNSIQLSNQQTSPIAGTYGNILVRIDGNAVSRNAVLVVSDGSASAVPEPATWAMMIFGMGAIGFAMRRKTVTTRFSYTV